MSGHAVFVRMFVGARSGSLAESDTRKNRRDHADQASASGSWTGVELHSKTVSREGLKSCGAEGSQGVQDSYVYTCAKQLVSMDVPSQLQPRLLRKLTAAPRYACQAAGLISDDASTLVSKEQSVVVAQLSDLFVDAL